MSTSVIPQLPSFVPPAIKKDLSWLMHHLILVGVMIIVLFVGVYGVDTLMQRHDEANAARSAASLKLVVDQVKVLEDKQAADSAAAVQREAAYNATINSLIATIAKRDAALSDQLKKNATLTAQEAAVRLSVQYKAQPGEVVANGENIVMDLPIARAAVSTFDSLVTCQADLKDTKTQLVAEQGKNTDLKTEVADRDATITGKNAELTAQAKKYDDQITVLKAQARKSKLKWFAAGVLVGTGIKPILHILGY